MFLNGKFKLFLSLFLISSFYFSSCNFSILLSFVYTLKAEICQCCQFRFQVEKCKIIERTLYHIGEMIHEPAAHLTTFLGVIVIATGPQSHALDDFACHNCHGGLFGIQPTLGLTKALRNLLLFNVF